MSESKLLIQEYPLMVLPSLAAKIGLNEAIFLQQLHYWLITSSHVRDGRRWVYNTYGEWQKQFPFWSTMTLRRIVGNLEKNGYIISGNYNKLKIDQTKWYTINYNKLPCVQNEQTHCSDRTIEDNNMNTPIPETTAETSYRDLNNQKGATSNESCTSVIFSYDTKAAVKYYFEYYRARFGYEHPRLKPNQVKRVMTDIETFIQEHYIDTDGMIEIVKQHFNRNMDTDYNINHFATEGVLLNLMYEAAY